MILRRLKRNIGGRRDQIVCIYFHITEEITAMLKTSFAFVEHLNYDINLYTGKTTCRGAYMVSYD